jgi:hypothetical protein
MARIDLQRNHGTIQPGQRDRQRSVSTDFDERAGCLGGQRNESLDDLRVAEKVLAVLMPAVMMSGQGMSLHDC